MSSSRKRLRRKDSEDDFDCYDDDGPNGEDVGAKWACQSCTFQNRFGAFRCAVCGTRKGTSTRKARLSDNIVEMQELVIQQVQKEQSLKRHKKSVCRKSGEPCESRGSSAAPSERPESCTSIDIKKEIPSAEKMYNGDSVGSSAEIKKEWESNHIDEEEKIERTESIIESPVLVTTPKNDETKQLVSISKMSISSILRDDFKPEKNPNEACGPSTSLQNPSSIFASTERQCTSASSSFGTNVSTSTHISPTISRPSSETDSTSDISTARSIEPSPEDRYSTPLSTKIPDEKICRNIPKKIVVVANGVPAVFFEYPRRLSDKHPLDNVGPKFV